MELRRSRQPGEGACLREAAGRGGASWRAAQAGGRDYKGLNRGLAKGVKLPTDSLPLPGGV